MDEGDETLNEESEVSDKGSRGENGWLIRYKEYIKVYVRVELNDQRC